MSRNAASCALTSALAAALVLPLASWGSVAEAAAAFFALRLAAFLPVALARAAHPCCVYLRSSQSASFRVYLQVYFRQTTKHTWRCHVLSQHREVRAIRRQ